MQQLSNIKIPASENQENLKAICAKKAKIPINQVKYFKIIKKSLDARDRSQIKYVYSVVISKDMPKAETKNNIKVNPTRKPIIIGLGPCGLFCGLELSLAGANPIIIERGGDVDSRQKSVNTFFKFGKLDTNCNIQFGEGGAGTFSDGKLTTGVNNPNIDYVLKTFVSFGAPSEIEYLSKPHVGSDNLPKVVKGIRNKIIENGGIVMFNTTLTDMKIEDDQIKQITVTNKNGQTTTFEDCDLILAIGHSARDTFEMLYRKGVYIEQKPFAVGFRIEHLQTSINDSQYGTYNQNLGLPASEYKLVSHAGSKGVYTFCMCPGGVVVPSCSEENMVVTNGMSNFLRDGINANSALLCGVDGNDFKSTDPLAGMYFQREIERKAFILGGGDYKAPISLVKDYLANQTSKAFENVMPTYERGVNFANLNDLLPQNLNDSIKKGLCDMDKKLKGFSRGDSLLTGVESRSSSPIRIVRDKNFESVNTKNLYPAGEGCGYAGGIMSASVDGIKIAHHLIAKYLGDKA